MPNACHVLSFWKIPALLICICLDSYSHSKLTLNHIAIISPYGSCAVNRAWRQRPWYVILGHPPYHCSPSLPSLALPPPSQALKTMNTWKNDIDKEWHWNTLFESRYSAWCLRCCFGCLHMSVCASAVQLQLPVNAHLVWQQGMVQVLASLPAVGET